MTKSIFLEIIASICGGFIIFNLGIYFFAFYLIFLGIGSLIVLAIVINDIFRKTAIWKTGLKFLCFGYIAALTVGLYYNFMEKQNEKEGEGVIVALYNYRHKTGKFPKSKNELPAAINSTRGSYFPDPTCQKFDFYYRDLYGFPRVFSSKDSSWTR